MPDNEPWNIVLIEASRDLQSLMRLSIEFTMCSNIRVAVSLEEGLDLISTSVPHIIVIDMDNNEIDIIQRLKQDSTAQEIPIIAICAHPSLQDRLTLQENGVKAILVDPFNPLYVKHAIRDLI